MLPKVCWRIYILFANCLPVFWALSLRWFKVVDDAMPPLPRKLPQKPVPIYKAPLVDFIVAGQTKVGYSKSPDVCTGKSENENLYA